MRGGGTTWGMMLALCLAAGCARAPKPAVSPAPAPAEPTPAEPLPPGGSARGLAVPEPDAEGRFETINSGVAGKEALWHVRSALNVAALGCRAEAALLKNYNGFLNDRKTALAAAYAEETARHRAASGLDRHMTQLYNFFAQPPAQARFCQVASEEAARIRAVPAAGLPDHAAGALGRLEAPFLAFYRDYDQYRRDWAAWKADPRAVAAVAPAPTAAARAEPASANWRIQIGAFTGKAAAEAAWQRARERAPSLAAYRPHYEAVPGRPELIRVQLGSADDRAGALRLCAAAAAGGFDCIPLARP
ncbi:MAG TPA: SPOR domain-containing protein [Sphingomonadaceae bacterium]|nr:SPOR domain-containing protein [Sphingomonadaceae bacterium]